MNNDQIGELAETIARADLSRPVGGDYARPLFRVAQFDGKHPVVEFLVDVLNERDASIGFFFIQVKGTTTDKLSTARLPIKVNRDSYNALVRVTAPTFLVGVDVTVSRSYLVAAHRPRKARVSSITKGFWLGDDAVKIGLYEEILSYWDANRPTPQRTRFEDV